MAQHDLRNTYRIAFVPETIGALVLLDSLGAEFDQIFCGLQVTTVGGPGSYQVKQSWNPQHPINAIAKKVLNLSGRNYEELEFDIHGSDERQYSSPGFRINMLTIARNIYYSYPEYHSSLDNLDLVNGQQISETFALYVRVINEFESRRVFVRVEPRGEPMLSRHNLYTVVGGALIPDSTMPQLDLALWVLFLCDGDLSTEDIADQVGIGHDEVLNMCERLSHLNLLREI
jgi:aminopeptidase-like protein